MLAKSAVQKLEIVKPLTTADTSIKTKALMTNKNKPIVITVKGSVNRMSNGLTMAFANPRSRAARISEPTSTNLKPLNI